MLSLAVVGCGHGSGSGEADKAPPPVAQVRTALASAGGSAEAVTAYGIAEQSAANEKALATQAEATLARIVAPTGTAVGAGQVVAILNPSPNSRLDLAKASTDARAANNALARTIRLRRDGLASDADINTARAAARTAAETLGAARVRGATLVLRAPVAGTVQGLTAKQGDLVAAGTTVATIGARGDLRLHLGVDPTIAARLRVGQPIEIAPINSNTTVGTSVLGVDPQVDPATRLASIYARLPAGAAIGPGQPVKAKITVVGGGSGVSIPYAALLDDGGHPYVFVVAGGIARRRDVRPGNTAGDTAEILQGLQPGERVVTEGGTALDDGMKVREQRASVAPAGPTK